MSTPTPLLLGLTFMLCAALGTAVVRGQGSPRKPSPLAGTWTLVAADVLHPDGSRARDYGESPKGLMVIDADGRYATQIYKSERPRFAAGDKAKGTPAEFQATVMGTSAHFGTVEVDTAQHTMTLHIEASSYPNWEGTQQVRSYELEGDELSYRVPPQPNGNVPLSVWRRVR